MAKEDAMAHHGRRLHNGVLTGGMRREQQAELQFLDRRPTSSSQGSRALLDDNSIYALFGRRAASLASQDKSWSAFIAIWPMGKGPRGTHRVIVPVCRRQDEGSSDASTSRLQRPCVGVARESILLQGLVRQLGMTERDGMAWSRSLRIVACPVQPISLERVAVRVIGAYSAASRASRDRLKRQIQQFLGLHPVIAVHDVLPLPSSNCKPSAPGSAQSLEVASCSPAQHGVCTKETVVTLLFSDHSDPDHSDVAIISPHAAAENSITNGHHDETDDEDFHSAVEDIDDEQSRFNRDNLRGPGNGHRTIQFDVNSESDHFSDDSSNMIDIAMPNLGLEYPDAEEDDSEDDNATALQRSVFSANTATTVVSMMPKGRRFETLLVDHRFSGSIGSPVEASHVYSPEEVTVYLDLRDIGKLKSFAGDWIRMEYGGDTSTSTLPVTNGASNPRMWRPVRLQAISSSISRLSHQSTDSVKSTMPKLGMPPFLWVNTGQPEVVQLVPFEAPTIDADTSHAEEMPPIASKVVLQKINSVLSTDKALQDVIVSSLKRYLSSSKRILQKNDVFAVPINTEITRLLGPRVSLSEFETEIRAELEMHREALSAERTHLHDFIWFRVQEIELDDGDELEPEETRSRWGDAALVETGSTTGVVSGSTTARIPLPPNLVRVREGPLPGLYSHPAKSAIAREMHELAQSATSALSTRLSLPATVILLHSTQRKIGKSFLVHQIAADLGLHIFDIDADALLIEGSGHSSSEAQVEAILTARAERAMACGPSNTIILLRHASALDGQRMAPVLREIIAKARILVMTCTVIDKLPERIRSLCTHEMQISAPNEGERASILSSVLANRQLKLHREVSIASLAQKSAALIAPDLLDVVQRAVIARDKRISDCTASLSRSKVQARPLTNQDLLVAAGDTLLHLTTADFDVALDAARSAYSDSIGAPKIPTVTWNDVGGLSYVKSAIHETISLPLTHPHLFSSGIKKRSGILFYGPPGTGKTLLAKAIATEYRMNFLSVKGPELLDMYIGESEANVRRVFRRARDASPCVIFFDELDSVAPKRGNQGDSGGVMDRIVSQLLAELDGMSSASPGSSRTGTDSSTIFIIGATNRPDLLDPALLRPGRFDKMLYLGIADTDAKQQTILEALTRKFTLEEGLRLDRVVKRLAFNLTGADLYALCADALLKAVGRLTEEVERKIRDINEERADAEENLPPITRAFYFEKIAKAEELVPKVSEQDFEEAGKELVGSVSFGELKHYDGVRKMFEGQDLSAGVIANGKAL